MIYHKPRNTFERYHLAMPNSWYAVCFSHELQPNEIKPVSILGKEYIIYRTSKGKVSVFNAYCPHQGTHIGHGGFVKDDCIVCPFHQWYFDSEGKCVKIPYATKIPPLERNSLDALPTVENDGVIYVYYHPEKHSPDFHLPDFSKEFPEETWTSPKRTTFYINTHLHEFGENGFDIAHFKPVHHSENNKITVHSEVTDKFMRYQLSLTYPGSGMGIPFKKVNVKSNWIYYGVAVFSNIVHLEEFPIVIHQIYNFTPLNDGRACIRFALRIKKDTLIKNNAFLRWLQIKAIHLQNIRLVAKNFREDQAIWENKIFRPMPVLVEGDGPILFYRRWAEQYYINNGPIDRHSS